MRSSGLNILISTLVAVGPRKLSKQRECMRWPQGGGSALEPGRRAAVPENRRAPPGTRPLCTPALLLVWKQGSFSFSGHLIQNGCLKALEYVDYSNCLIHLLLNFLNQSSLSQVSTRSQLAVLGEGARRCQSHTCEASGGRKGRIRSI